MARSFSNAKLLSAALADGFSLAINRRGYSAVAPAVNAVRGGTRSELAKQAEKKKGPQNTPWVPDPKTGCYRPENTAAEIDVAELRAVLLKQKINRQ